ncbi:MAG: Rab family GTPase [Candidatus Kariarchaeaceae archaeon]
MLACKVVLLGEGGVGKTSLRKKYLGEGFESTYQMTIGADFAAKRMKIDNWDITANIWDLAGQTQFKLMRETYYRGVSGALLVFDISRPETFVAVDHWVEELKQNNRNELVPIALIGNKSDLRDETEDPVPQGTAERFANEVSAQYGIKVQYVESSALTGLNVQTPFEVLIQEIFYSFLANR